MACNCGKNRRAAQPRRVTTTSGSSGSATQQFSLIIDGKTLGFGSRLEADAENARRGYRGIVRQN